MKFIFTILFMLFFSYADACQFDTDCDPGNKCKKPSFGSIYGVCTGGIGTGNSHDSQPVYNRNDPKDGTGESCSFDTDCGVGQRCHKGSYSTTGACM